MTVLLESLESALVRAESLRSTREATIGQLASGQCSLAEVFERATVEPDVGVIRALAILESMPGWGKVAVRRAMAALDVGATVALADLDGAQRDRILAAFS